MRRTCRRAYWSLSTSLLYLVETPALSPRVSTNKAHQPHPPQSMATLYLIKARWPNQVDGLLRYFAHPSIFPPQGPYAACRHLHQAPQYRCLISNEGLSSKGNSAGRIGKGNPPRPKSQIAEPDPPRSIQEAYPQAVKLPCQQAPDVNAYRLGPSQFALQPEAHQLLTAGYRDVLST